MNKALIVGGSNGIGLSLVCNMAATCDKVLIVDKIGPDIVLPTNVEYVKFDLLSEDFSIFDKMQDIDTLMITAGFGHLSLFKDITEQEIVNYFNINTIAVIRIIKHFYNQLQRTETFRCGVMVSIAGFMSSPFFSVYAATKSALKIFIESVNVELEKSGTHNRILNVSPGSIKGTKFDNHTTNDLTKTDALAKDIIANLESGNDLFIPDYEEVYRDVLRRYHDDFRKEGLHSYDYKIQTGRIQTIK